MRASMKTPLPYSRWLAVGLALSLSLTAGGQPLQAQPGSNDKNTIEVIQGVQVVVPSPWFLAFHTQNGVEILYPLRAPQQQQEQRKSEGKPFSEKPLITAEARISIRVET